MENLDLRENLVCKLGFAWDPQSDNALGEIGLSDSNIRDGIGIFGENCSYNVESIAPQLIENEYTYVILDFGSHYRNILYRIEKARVLRLGTDFSLNPLYGEGLDPSEYVDSFVAAFDQAYGLSTRENRLLYESLINAVESAEGGTLTLSEFEGTLREFSESTNGAELHGKEEVTRIAKPLFQHDGENKPFSSQQTMPISKLFSELTIIELERSPSHRFRAFIQALIAMKYLAHLRVSKDKKAKDKPTIIMIDSAEQLLPTRFNLPSDQRRPSFIYYLDELKEKEASIHVCSKFPYEMDQLVFSLLGTKIFHQTPDTRFWRTIQSQLGLEEKQRSFYFGLKPEQALMKTKRTQATIPLIVDRPSWLFFPPLTDAQIEEALTGRGYPIERIHEERKMHIADTMLERDFESNTLIAYDILKTLKEYSNVTKTALTQFLTQYKQDMVLQILREMERRGYVATRLMKKPHKMWILSLGEVSERALIEWEKHGQNKLTDNDEGGE